MMSPVSYMDEILDYAIDREQEAYDFYLALSDRVERSELRELFHQFAGEELEHKKKLEGIKSGHQLLPISGKVQDLKISDYVVDVDSSEDLDYKKALIIAMKKEKASFHLYTDLARASERLEIKLIFEALAQEEAKHKLRFELEFDEEILKEN